MNGSACDGSEEGFSDIIDYLKEASPNGVAVNGILVWLDIQQHSTPPNVLQAQAAASFREEEIEVARCALWKAVGSRKNLIGEIIAKRTQKRKRKC